jgi:phosphatidylserine synthase
MAMLAIILLTFTPMLRYLGRPDLTFQAVCCALVLAAVIKVSGKLRTQWWFWATMIPVALTHVLFILRVPWPKWVPAGILIGFAAVDLLMIFYLISFVAKLMGKEALAKDSFAGDNSAGKSS